MLFEYKPQVFDFEKNTVLYTCSIKKKKKEKNNFKSDFTQLLPTTFW